MNKNLPQLSITRSLKTCQQLTAVLAVLLLLTSLAALLLADFVYPDAALRRSFLSNDVVNLVIGLPALIIALWLTRRGKFLGLMIWSGALFYITYNFLAGAIATAFLPIFWVHLALVVLSLLVIIKLFASLDFATIKTTLHGRVKPGFYAIVLLLLGALFFLRSLLEVIGSLNGSGMASSPELAVAIADLFITTFWMVGAIALLRKSGFGYASVAGLLFQASMLFIGLLVFFILQPAIAGVPFPVEDFVVIFSMSLVCIIPTILYLVNINKAFHTKNK